jgi:hypothetical protein
MFSDKYRVFKIIVPFLLIVTLVFYARAKGPLIYPGYKEAKKQPSLFIGKKINFGGKILEVKDDYFYVESEKEPVKVFGKLTKDKVNYLISGNAVYQADGSLKALDFHLSNLRGYKITLSIIPIILIVYLFLKEYRFDFKKTKFKKRNMSS